MHTSPPQRLHQPPPALKLFDDSSLADPEHLTLRGAFELYLLPELGADQAGTLSAYLCALNHWEADTANPPIEAIDDDCMAEWRKKLLAKFESKNTVVKCWRHIRPILRKLAHRSTKNPGGRGLIADVPYFKPVKTPKPEIRTATRRELSALYDACRVVTRPKIHGVPAEHVWQAALVCWFNLGPRCFDLWAQRETGNSGWRWEHIDFLSSPRTVRYYDTKKRDWHTVPMNDTVEAHLKRIRTDRVRVFPATTNREHFYSQWRLILAEALQSCPSVAGLEPHDLRRTCQTEFDWIKPLLGDFIVNHKARDVGGAYYRNFARKAARAVHRLKQPDAFHLVNTSEGPQKVLF